MDNQITLPGVDRKELKLILEQLLQDLQDNPNDYFEIEGEIALCVIFGYNPSTGKFNVQTNDEFFNGIHDFPIQGTCFLLEDDDLNAVIDDLFTQITDQIMEVHSL